MLLRALRLIVGAAAGFLFWWCATPVYNDVLSLGAERILRIDKRLCGPHAETVDRQVFVHPRDCVAPAVTVPADQLTYNIILLVALFAMQGRKILGFLASCLVVAITHILSLAVSIESTYAVANGGWSQQHYSLIEQHLWLSVEFFWRLVGMFAVVFACWWIAQPPWRPAK
jgi:hypothetical protein